MRGETLNWRRSAPGGVAHDTPVIGRHQINPVFARPVRAPRERQLASQLRVGPVIIWAPLFQEMTSTRVMHPCVVQDDQSGTGHHVRPQVVCQRALPS
jgi:hypothetical protein